MKHMAAKHPFSELMRGHGKAVIVGILTTCTTAGHNGLLFAHMPAYLDKTLHYDPRSVALAQNASDRKAKRAEVCDVQNSARAGFTSGTRASRTPAYFTSIPVSQ